MYRFFFVEGVMESNALLRKLRILTVCLIVSGVLNVGLLVCGVLSRVQEENPSLAGPLVKKVLQEEASMSPFFMQIAGKSFHELVSYLTNRDPVGDGYLKRDMAVCALVAFHHFNLEKSLGGISLQRRVVALSDGSKVELFPGLSEDQFDAVIRFAYEEKWPLTSEGLFKLLKKHPVPRDPTLIQAFAMTPEFSAVQALFQRVDGFQDAESLVNLISEGSWDTLRHFAKGQAEQMDLSLEKRRHFLLLYLSQKSPTSARLLVQLDYAFVAKRMEDLLLLDLLSLCHEKTEGAERLCLELLKSPRADAIWTEAALHLYAYAGEAPPQPWDLKAAVARFAPQKMAPVVIAPVPAIAPQRSHTVKEGESLWKIAKHYNVKVDDILKCNAIDKDRLRPGMTIKIPN